MDTALHWLDATFHFIDILQRAFDSLAVVAVAIIFGSLFAGVGGFMGARFRLYGAMIGGMIANLFVKADGMAFWPALGAMILMTIVCYALGHLGPLIRILGPSARKSDS